MSGMTDDKIPKRNMIRTTTLKAAPRRARAYGSQSVNERGYWILSGGVVLPSRRLQPTLRQRAIRQRFRKMQPSHALGLVEIGKRARHAQDAVIAARGKLHGLGGIAQKFEAGV